MSKDAGKMSVETLIRNILSGEEEAEERDETEETEEKAHGAGDGDGDGEGARSNTDDDKDDKEEKAKDTKENSSARDAKPPKKPLDMTLTQVLKVDAEHRVEGVADDLHPLESLVSVPWDFSVPTLVSTREPTANPRICESVQELRQAFEEEFPLLKGVPLSNVLVAGGSVGRFVRQGGCSDKPENQDVDLFL